MSSLDGNDTTESEEGAREGGSEEKFLCPKTEAMAAFPCSSCGQENAKEKRIVESGRVVHDCDETRRGRERGLSEREEGGAVVKFDAAECGDVRDGERECGDTP